tara:strand:+ start:4511 stop:4696 length:186 start_codon:yes stop_codon:yes gene_type:complete
LEDLHQIGKIIIRVQKRPPIIAKLIKTLKYVLGNTVLANIKVNKNNTNKTGANCLFLKESG